MCYCIDQVTAFLGETSKSWLSFEKERSEKVYKKKVLVQTEDRVEGERKYRLRQKEVKRRKSSVSRCCAAAVRGDVDATEQRKGTCVL